MAIITIARERGAYGRIVAKMLAEKMSAHFIDCGVVDARLEAMGITEKKRSAFDERKPGFFAALTNAVEEYVCCLKQVMYEEAKADSCVILGRGSQVLFADVPGAVRVRLVASPQVRYQRVAESEGLDIRQAKELVDRIDHDRAGFNSYFFDTEWANPSAYQMILNTEHLTPENAVEIICSLVKQTVTPEIEADAQTMLKNLAMGQAIEREILHVRRIPVFFLKVTCSGTQATLAGVAHTTDDIEKAREAAVAMGMDHIDCRIEIGLHGQYDSPELRKM